MLARLFALHPEPNERCTTLLVRWVWRSFLGLEMDERTFKTLDLNQAALRPFLAPQLGGKRLVKASIDASG